MELNKILIGIVLVSVVSFTFLLFITDGVTQYNPTLPANYNSSFIKMNDNIKNLSDITSKTENKTQSIDGNSNAVSDFLGFFFGNGYKAVKVFISGMKLTTDIANDGIENTMGSSGLGNIWKMAIGIIIVIILISILLHFVIKSDRL